MSAGTYRITHAEITGELITAQRAAELYDAANASERSELVGDVEAGFAFWTGTEQVPRLVRHRIEPTSLEEE